MKNSFSGIEFLREVNLGGKPEIGNSVAVIEGIEKGNAAIMDAPDLRAGAALVIAGLAAEGKTEIIGSECVNISYPNFYSDLNSLMQ